MKQIQNKQKQTLYQKNEIYLYFQIEIHVYFRENLSFYLVFIYIFQKYLAL